MQCAIDGCKKTFEIDVSDEIKRIRSQSYMKREKDYPKFMKYTKAVAMMAHGKERPYEDISKDKQRIIRRIDDAIVCPMNWLEESLDQIKEMKRVRNIPIGEIFIYEEGTADHGKVKKIRKLVHQYDSWVKGNLFKIEKNDPDVINELIHKQEVLIEKVKKHDLDQITINHLIAASINLDGNLRGRKSKYATKLSKKILNVLYTSYHDEFMACFRSKK